MYKISRHKRLVSVRFGRTLLFDDVQSYTIALYADPEFDPTFSEIVDLSVVEELVMTPEETMKLADLADPFSPGAKRAFIAQTDMQIRAARMHQLLRNDEVNIRIFGSIQEAEAWIESATPQHALTLIKGQSRIRT